MRDWVCRWVVAPCLALLPVCVTAQDDKGGQELWAQCQAINSPFQQGVCLGYLGAVIDTVNRAATDPQSAFCLPEDYPTGRVREDFMAYLDANRDARDLPAADAIRAMIVSRFPCPDAPG